MTTDRWIRFAAGAMLAALALAATGPGRAEPKEKLSKACQVPDWVHETELALPHTARRMNDERRIKIVALGSSSTKGTGASGPGAAWPAQLETALARRLPDVTVAVVNRGEIRQSVPQMLNRLESDVLAEKPSLVIWEAGTSEAVLGGDVDLLTEGLLEGIDRLAAAGTDVMLMDMQYARNTARIINFQPYVDAIGRVGMMRDVFVFPRFEIMRDWVENEQVSFEGQSRGEVTKTADQVYSCLAKFIAGIIANSLKP